MLERSGSSSISSVSIVLATHNGARFLPEQLASLAGQTMSPLEIIISDDASTDETSAIVERFRLSSSVPVHVFKNVPKLGYGENFVTAAEKASGEFIAFCDQDDVWEPTKLARCTECFNGPDVSMVVHTARLIDDRGTDIGEFRQGISVDRVAPPLSYDPWGTFWGFSITFRKDILAVTRSMDRFCDYVAPEHPLAHDRWICFWAQILGDTIELAEPLVRYRQHGSNLYGSSKLRRVRVDRAAVIANSSVYVEATAAMLRLIDEVDPDAERIFPAFDRLKARNFIDRAYRQQLARAGVYQMARPSALARILRNIVQGHYSNVHDGRMRWRSIAKDLRVTLPKAAPFTACLPKSIDPRHSQLPTGAVRFAQARSGTSDTIHPRLGSSADEV